MGRKVLDTRKRGGWGTRTRREWSLWLHPCSSMYHHGSLMFRQPYRKSARVLVSEVRGVKPLLILLCRPAATMSPQFWTWHPAHRLKSVVVLIPRLRREAALLTDAMQKARGLHRRLDRLGICFLRGAGHAFIFACTCGEIRVVGGIMPDTDVLSSHKG